MKTGLIKLSIAVLVWVASFIFLSSNVFAQVAQGPWLDFIGKAYYCDANDKGGGNADWCSSSGGNSDGLDFAANELAFVWGSSADPQSGIAINFGNYIDGTQFSSSQFTPDDIITDNGAWISIGQLFNDGTLANKFDFGASAGSGAVSFDITDGTNTYFSSTLDSFTLVENVNAPGSYSLNAEWDLNNITDWTYPNTVTFNDMGSQYIQELEQRYNSGYAINFQFSISMIPGSADFLADASSSTFQGKMAVVPEPVSSVLFIAGGLSLAARRFWGKKKITTN